MQQSARYPDFRFTGRRRAEGSPVASSAAGSQQTRPAKRRKGAPPALPAAPARYIRTPGEAPVTPRSRPKPSQSAAAHERACRRDPVLQALDLLIWYGLSLLHLVLRCCRIQWSHSHPESVLTSWAIGSYVRANVPRWPAWPSVGLVALSRMQLVVWACKSSMRRYCRSPVSVGDSDDLDELQPLSLLSDCPVAVILLEVSCVLGFLLLLLTAAAWRTSAMVPTALVSPTPVAVLTAAASIGFTIGSVILLLAILWMLLPWHLMLALSTCLTGSLLTSAGLVVGRTVQDDDTLRLTLPWALPCSTWAPSYMAFVPVASSLKFYQCCWASVGSLLPLVDPCSLLGVSSHQPRPPGCFVPSVFSLLLKLVALCPR